MAKAKKPTDFEHLIKTLSSEEWHARTLDWAHDRTTINLAGADLSGMDLTDYRLTGANLAGANLRGTNLTGAILLGANLTDANLESAVLCNANLNGANLEGANLRNAELGGAGTSFAGALLRQTDIRGVDFCAGNFGANVTNAEFIDCIVDRNTKIPPPPVDHYANLRASIAAVEGAGKFATRAAATRGKGRTQGQ